MSKCRDKFSCVFVNIIIYTLIRYAVTQLVAILKGWLRLDIETLLNSYMYVHASLGFSFCHDVHEVYLFTNYTVYKN